MTRRERLEAKVEKRQDWADGRRAKAAGVAREAEKYHGDVAFNTQPGHIPERARLIRREERAFEDLRVAEHHESKAAGLADQLERSVFSDDADAIAQLEARISERTAEADKKAALNKAWRKGGAAAVKALGYSDALVATMTETMAQCPWLKSPVDTTNLRASIRADRERLEDIRRRQARTEKAVTSGGVLIEGDEYVRVTFAEKPARRILDALKAAGFSWGAGSWCGARAKLPADVLAMTERQETIEPTRCPQFLGPDPDSCQLCGLPMDSHGGSQADDDKTVPCEECHGAEALCEACGGRGRVPACKSCGATDDPNADTGIADCGESYCPACCYRLCPAGMA